MQSVINDSRMVYFKTVSCGFPLSHYALERFHLKIKDILHVKLSFICLKIMMIKKHGYSHFKGSWMLYLKKKGEFSNWSLSRSVTFQPDLLNPYKSLLNLASNKKCYQIFVRKPWQKKDNNNKALKMRLLTTFLLREEVPNRQELWIE